MKVLSCGRWAALSALGLLASPGLALADQTTDATTRQSQQATTKTATAATSQKTAPKASSAPDPEEIQVVGRNLSTVASTATKSETPLVDTAQSVTVITRNEMDIRGVLSLNQAVRYTAGITPDLRGSTATRYDMFDLRGFTVPTFLDGLKVQSSPTGYATPQTDTSRIERIEVLKGPASALYGQSSPGGLVALSSKLPTDNPFYGNLMALGGSFDLYRVDADVGGFATRNGFIRYRLYGTVNGSHSQLSRTASRRFSISPAVTIGGNGPTTLTLLGNYQYDPINGAYGSVPLVGSLVRAPYGYVSRSFYDGDLSYERFNRKQGALTYILNHRFNQDWTFSTRGRYNNTHTEYASIYNTGLYSTPTTIERGAYGTNEHLETLAFDSQFRGHVKTGPLHHSLMFGFDYQQSHSTEKAYYTSAPDLNVLYPNYNIAFSQPPLYLNYRTRQHQIGLYAQDEVRLGHLYLTGSLRNDWYRSHQDEYVYNSHTSENPTQITWRASGLYHFDFGLSPYISYSTSFQPQSGIVSSDGGKTMRQADPSLGKQLEGGVKYQLPNTSLLLTLAGFHIEQTNVLVSAGNLGYSTESGKVHSDGFEFEAHMDMWKHLLLTAAYSYQRVHDDSTGKPLIQSGRGNASLFAFYQFSSGPLKGFGIGGGLRHANRSYGGTASFGDVWVPSYTVFDASARYDLANLSPSLKGWVLNASVRNLFDKRYIASCYGYAPYDEWCWYGARRNAQASIGFHW